MFVANQDIVNLFIEALQNDIDYHTVMFDRFCSHQEREAVKRGDFVKARAAQRAIDLNNLVLSALFCKIKLNNKVYFGHEFHVFLNANFGVK